MSNRLISTTFTNVDISAGANAVYTYTADAARAVFFRVFCTSVAGNGDYVFWLTLQEGGAGNTATVLPKTTGTAASTDTTIAALTTFVNVDSGDVVKLYIDGLAGDTSVSGTIKVYELDYLRPTTAGQHNVDVAATGEVGLDWGNIANQDNTANLSDTTIKAVTNGVTVSALDAGGAADFFTVNSGQTGAGAVAGSVVHEIGHAVLAIGTVFPAGAIEFTYTVTNSVTGLPIEGVEVWFSTDLAHANIVWKGDTDAFGVARDTLGNLPNLDAGVYYVWRQRSGYTFADPDIEDVS